MNTTRSQRGVTLIEMLVVVTIIALFAALVGPQTVRQGRQGQAHRGARADQLFHDGAGLLQARHRQLSDHRQGLQALRVKPEDVDQWAGPYLPQEFRIDPWGHPYLYKFPGEHGDEPDIVSLGADGQPGGEGNNADIVSWSNK